jgi:hypothetical protein
VSREQLPYMSDEQFNLFAFIYRSKKGCIKVANLMEAKDYEKNPEWEHLATLDANRWIECLLNNTQKERNKQIKEILK